MFMYKSYDILGYTLFIDYGRTYHILCNRCWEESIEQIANNENITNERPIFVDDNDDRNVCEHCNKLITVEND